MAPAFKKSLRVLRLFIIQPSYSKSSQQSGSFHSLFCGQQRSMGAQVQQQTAGVFSSRL